MRNRLIHHYLGVNLKDVWYTVKVDIPALKNEILAIHDVLGTEK
ncbi:HepT-like ribonuclease domain-containing protein [Methanosarcina siciliae]|nr:HepT-like ribonuclease domain-containing protein [Methanosarcina siciliae]